MEFTFQEVVRGEAPVLMPNGEKAGLPKMFIRRIFQEIHKKDLRRCSEEGVQNCKKKVENVHKKDLGWCPVAQEVSHLRLLQRVPRTMPHQRVCSGHFNPNPILRVGG
eukprot:10900248-Karenia_brevis.AAC.1